MKEETIEIAKEAKTGSSKRQNGNGKHAEDVKIEIPQLDFRQATFEVEGLSPLIVNKFSEKAKQQMLDKQMKKATKGKEAKNPEEQYKSSIYFFKDGQRTGFPAVGFKAALVRAGKQLGLPMTETRGKFHVLADEDDLIEIKGDHVMREDMVRLATGVADIRFRAEYKQWSAKLTIHYNAAVISAEQLANLLNVAGFSCGIGEWRPERSNSGSYGLFAVK